ncbi:glutamate--tRNA ligase [bacterium]|nr:glutamate--tRNA ligase [bacterium]
MTIRTRFAPSPTGQMHVGNLRTALYAWLLAKSQGGAFILRIEDTDQARKVEGAVDFIYNILADTGLTHDEGPDKGGEYGPYTQSERLPIYKEMSEKLIELGGAYRCFCTPERLDSVREVQKEAGEQQKYDGHCLHLSPEEIQKNLDANLPFVVRQKMPLDGATTFDDEVFGEITIEHSTLDDLILMKTDGFPTYNFANVVDDHLMKITHVVRGSEYLISTPKYNLLYQAFGWTPPKYVHVSAVMRDAKKKLSKRDGDANYRDFIEKGYLKEALLNYIALLGWNAGDDREKFTLSDLVEAFSIAGISKSPAIFDEQKLRWLNGEYIRELSAEAFQKIAEPWIRTVVKSKTADVAYLCTLLQKRTEILSEIPEKVDFIEEIPEYSVELYTHKKMKTNPENGLQSLKILQPALEAFEPWDHAEMYPMIVKLAEVNDINKKKLLWSLRVALSGKALTPGGGTDLAAIFGKSESMRRLNSAIDKLEKEE